MTIESNGSNVVVSKGKVIIDGKVIKNELIGNIEVSIDGDITSIDCAGEVIVNGNVNGNIDCGGSVKISGNVDGSIDCGGSCECGNVGGDIDAGGSVKCKR